MRSFGMSTQYWEAEHTQLQGIPPHIHICKWLNCIHTCHRQCIQVFAREVRGKIIKKKYKQGKKTFSILDHVNVQGNKMTLFLVHTGAENKPCFPSDQEMLLELSVVWFPALLLWQNTEYFISIKLYSTHSNLLPTAGIAFKNPCDIASLCCGDRKCSHAGHKKNWTITCCVPITMLTFDTHTNGMTYTLRQTYYTTSYSVMTNTAIHTGPYRPRWSVIQTYHESKHTKWSVHTTVHLQILAQPTCTLLLLFHS